MPSSGTAASYGSFSPTFLRNLHTVLQSSIPFFIISIYHSFLIHGKKIIGISYNEDVSNNLKSTYYAIIILQRKKKVIYKAQEGGHIHIHIHIADSLCSAESNTTW